jgi:hypothetical protein
MSAATWRVLAELITDADLAAFRQLICVKGGHPGLAALGACTRCGGVTSSCSMSICDQCAGELGVCPFDQRLTGWGSESAPEREAIGALWLALLIRGYSEERAAAKRALDGWPDPELVTTAREIELHSRLIAPGQSPVEAEFIVGFHGAIPIGVVEGALFHEARIARVDSPLRFATVRAPDAAGFEARARRDPRVRYVELNREAAELE